MTPDLDKLAALAGAAREYEPPWDLVTMDLAPAARDYVRALSPDVVLALVERVRALEQAVGGFLWLGNNLHNIARAPTRFRELYEAALVDARAVLADPHDAHDDEAVARWTAARIDGGVGQ